MIWQTAMILVNMFTTKNHGTDDVVLFDIAFSQFKNRQNVLSG